MPIYSPKLYTPVHAHAHAYKHAHTHKRKHEKEEEERDVIDLTLSSPECSPTKLESKRRRGVKERR